MDPKMSESLEGAEKERITKATIRLSSGEILMGRQHSEILAQIFKKQKVSGEQNLLAGKEEGFITSTGRFVSREEATTIAFEAGQIGEKQEKLRTQDLNLD